VVLCIAGNGLKTAGALDGALPEAPLVAPRLREMAARGLGGGGAPGR